MTVYFLCGFCGGRGCLACDGERQRAMEKESKPVFVAKNEDDITLLVEAVGTKALEKAYSAGGGGIMEIQRNLVTAAIKQQLRRHE